jgi:cysteine desulfurase/selenocysteine lyase
LSRLANQFFSAMPSTATPMSAPGALRAALGEPPLNVDLPNESQLQALVVPPIANAPHPAAFLQAAARALPGGGSALYFMDRAAALGASTPGLSATPGLDVPGARSDKLYSLVSVEQPQFDVGLIRRDFPILAERVHGRPLVWLDNAATTQKPQSVIDRLQYFYEHENSNIHRAAHELAARATDAYEGAREKVRAFLNGASSNEVIFVRGATEAINLVAQSWGRQNIGKDDEIIISWLEHHANIVPWQQLAGEKGARIRVIPVDDRGQILQDEYAKLLGPRTKLVSFTQVSNALGTITPAKAMVDLAHSAGAKVLVDGAQAVSHMPVDVRALDSDWYVFSGHKVFAPAGIGVLHGKEKLLNEMPPWQGGGNMITDVTFERTLFQPAPGRFEAGTGNIADAVGLGAAIDYVTKIGMSLISAYEQQLLAYATKRLQEISGLRLIGTAAEKASVLSFVLDGHKSEDVGAALSRDGIAVRAGHHCAQPILRRFGLESTVRPSLAFYNTTADIDALIGSLQRLTSGAMSPAAMPRTADFLR